MEVFSDLVQHIIVMVLEAEIQSEGDFSTLNPGVQEISYPPPTPTDVS
jgi:hypothetical protein